MVEGVAVKALETRNLSWSQKYPKIRAVMPLVAGAITAAIDFFASYMVFKTSLAISAVMGIVAAELLTRLVLKPGASQQKAEVVRLQRDIAAAKEFNDYQRG